MTLSSTAAVEDEIESEIRGPDDDRRADERPEAADVEVGTIASVSQSMNMATPNQARPSVKIASGNVSSFRIGLSSVFSTPNTRGGDHERTTEPLNVTPLSSQATSARTTALRTQESARRASTRQD